MIAVTWNLLLIAEPNLPDSHLIPLVPISARISQRSRANYGQWHRIYVYICIVKSARCFSSPLLEWLVIFSPSDRSSTGRFTTRTAAVTDVTWWAGADATDSITVRGANLRRSAWTTRTAVFRARVSTTAARPRLPSTATATTAGSARVARRVSFTARAPRNSYGGKFLACHRAAASGTLMLNRCSVLLSFAISGQEKQEKGRRRNNVVALKFSFNALFERQRNILAASRWAY